MVRHRMDPSYRLVVLTMVLALLGALIAVWEAVG